MGLSVDSNSSHLGWLYDIFQKTGIRVPFPIIADQNGKIARKYGMISNDVSTTETVRNVFIIDDKGIVRAILVYPMQAGRCIPEILRLLQALQTADNYQCMTPANWIPGDPVIVPMPTTFCELEKREKEIQERRNGMSWYLSFKEVPKKEIKCDCKRGIEEGKEENRNIEKIEKKENRVEDRDVKIYRSENKKTNLK